jgi:hypothetical protein
MKRIFLWCMVLFLTAFQCEEQPPASVSRDLEENFKLWQESGIRSYSFDLRVICFCPFREPFSIVVRDGVTESISGNDPESYDYIPSTIDQLYLTLQDYLAQDPVTFRAKYHPTYHYPEDVYVDVSEQIADEEMGYMISNFKVLN